MAPILMGLNGCTGVAASGYDLARVRPHANSGQSRSRKAIGDSPRDPAAGGDVSQRRSNKIGSRHLVLRSR